MLFRSQQNWRHIEQSSRLRVKQVQQEIEHWNQLIDKNSQTTLYFWKSRLEPLKHQLQSEGLKSIQTTAQKLEQLQQRINVTANRQVEITKHNLEQTFELVGHEAKRALNFQHNQVIQWISFILSSGPKTQLNRGFAIAKTEQGSPIKTAENARAAGHVHLQFIDGTVSATIDSNAKIIKNS